ncbi:hypothetical protein ES703_117645 [subsurface metagenome]
MLKSVYDTDKDGKVEVVQSQISDLDHDAQKIKGVIIDDGAKADQKVLAYDFPNNKIVYIEQAPAGAILNSIQYGSITISDTDITNTATINSVDSPKSVAFFLGCYGTSYDAACDLAGLYLLNSTTVLATRNAGVPGQSMTINFCVIEFSDGIASLQLVFIYLPDGSSQEDQSINEVDISKSLLFFGGLTTDAEDISWVEIFPRIILLNSTTVRANTLTPTYGTGVYCSVLEFS